MRRFRKAFSLVELIIVIVVIGILATMTTQRLKRDEKSEAKNKILTMIRYSRSLALHDDKQLRDKPKWQQGFWSFRVYKCRNENKYYIMIASNENKDDHITKEETAVDPSNGKNLYAYNDCKTAKKDSQVSPNVFLDNFGINRVQFLGCSGVGSNSKYIGFDKFGRVYRNFNSSNTPDYRTYRTSDCKIKFSFETGGNFQVRVDRETGFAYIEGEPNL